ncbi:class E sortase [Candidatus Roizmanbacteria bacterium]|nr:class E sortase [Candidatus Roizmanbacteria bacterium]
MKAKVKHYFRKAKQREYLKVLILRTIGNFLILSSLFMITKTFYKPVREEVRYFLDTTVKKKYVVGTKEVKEAQELKAGGLKALFATNQVEVLVPEDPSFSVVIPKVGANARVLANIDASDENIYLPALQEGVAHTLGTAFPGERGHIFLFAHSTDYFWNVGTYNAVFYLLSKLVRGDEVNVFYKGQRYVYRVIGKRIVDPERVEFLTRKTNNEFLTLQTCWPPGTTLKRLLIFATRAKQ